MQDDSESVEIIPLTADLLETADQLGDAAYSGDLYEPKEWLRNKLQTFPEGCWGCRINGGLKGYLFSFPWRKEEVFPLSAAFEIPKDPNCFYIHDLVVSREYQRRGLAAQLAAKAFEIGRGYGFDLFSLVAVQGAEGFWEKLGFQVIGELQYTPQSKALKMWKAD